MARPVVIGIYSSRPQSGKSTIAEHLITRYGYKRIRFASTLKAMVRAMLLDLGVDKKVLNDIVEGGLKETPLDEAVFGASFTARRIMQTLGTEWGRNTIDPDLWIKIMDQKLKRAAQAGLPVVIDDVRFENEYELINSLPGSLLVRVDRCQPTDDSSTDHPSEGRLDTHTFGLVIKNDADVAQLLQKVNQVFDGFQAAHDGTTIQVSGG